MIFFILCLQRNGVPHTFTSVSTSTITTSHSLRSTKHEYTIYLHPVWGCWCGHYQKLNPKTGKGWMKQMKLPVVGTGVVFKAPVPYTERFVDTLEYPTEEALRAAVVAHAVGNGAVFVW